jgi:hypothetical protein
MEELQYAVSILLDRKTVLPWPDRNPLPAAGDFILIEHDGKPHTMKVTARQWTVVPDEETGEIGTIVTIQAQSQPLAGQGRASAHPLNM